MKKNMLTKIMASAASIAMITAATAVPSDSIISKIANTNTMTAYAYSYVQSVSKNPDSTGTFYVQLNNETIKNGKIQATEAWITSVVSSKIPQNAALNIPSEVTVSGKNYNGQSFGPITVPVTKIAASAFANQKSLIAVNIPSTVKTIDSDAFKSSGLVALELPATINHVASGAFSDCDGLYNVNFKCKQPTITAFEDCDNLKTFNNVPILNHNPKTGEPILNATVLNELYAVDSSYLTIKRCPFIKQYAEEYINYIVNTNTNSSDSDIIKAKKLHDWLVNHVNYAYDKDGNIDMMPINGDDWAPFFHRKNDGKFYAVCDGYSGAYKLLLDAAGIECGHVSGDSIGDGLSHAWNVVKICGNYYHVDTTWDDGGSIKYEHFMRSDDVINDSHEYNWDVEINGVKYTRSTGVAKYDLQKIGDVNFDNKVDEEDTNQIQRYTLNLRRFSDEQKIRADVNLDGEVDMCDILSINMGIAKMNKSNYSKSLFEFIYVDGKMSV